MDLHSNINDDTQHLTMITTEDIQPTVNTLTLQDIDELLQIKDTNLKSFTPADLDKYIQDYWQLDIQINPDLQTSTS